MGLRQLKLGWPLQFYLDFEMRISVQAYHVIILYTTLLSKTEKASPSLAEAGPSKLS